MPGLLFSTTSLKSKLFTYDFAVHGGAIGPILTGIFLPIRCQLLSITINPVTDLASGGVIAVVDIGIQSNGAIINNAAQGAAGTFADYVPATWGFGYTAVDTIPYFTFPANTTNAINSSTGEITIDISVDTLTGGKFIGVIHYLEIAN